MITRELTFGCALLAALLLPFASPAEGEGEGKKEKSTVIEGSLKQITLGTHWAGPKLEGPENLRGKVVLLKIWGG